MVAAPTDFDPDAEERYHDEQIALAEATPLERLRGRLITGDAIKDVSPPAPLISGVIDRGATAVLFGRAGSGKSFVAMDWGLCVATGSDWFGRPVEQVPVLYVVGEGLAGLGQRVAAWESARQVWEAGPLHWLPVGVNLHNLGQTDVLGAMVLELGVGFVVFDTLARCMVGADENSARDMGQVVAKR